MRAVTNETFTVNVGLSGGDAVVGDAQGLVTIVDDGPRITIASVSKNEGNSGNTPFAFTVSLSAASSAAVTLNFATADGSSQPVEEYDRRGSQRRSVVTTTRRGRQNLAIDLPV